MLECWRHVSCCSNSRIFYFFRKNSDLCLCENRKAEALPSAVHMAEMTVGLLDSLTSSEETKIYELAPYTTP